MNITLSKTKPITVNSKRNTYFDFIKYFFKVLEIGIFSRLEIWIKILFQTTRF
jgi:hypothetical protein